MSRREREPAGPHPTAVGPDADPVTSAALDSDAWRTLVDRQPTLREVTRIALPEPTPARPSGPPPADAPVPDGFVYEGPLGRGAMGEVHRVRDPALGRTVALKVLQASSATSRAALQRFVEEAQVTAQLQHPGIVPVHQIGTLPDGRLYFLMQEVRGRTLSEVIGELHRASDPDGFRPGPSGLTFRRILDAFRLACEAVAYAHRRGVVHRDLKPDNLMVGAHGEILVMDWGIAKILGGLHRPEPDPEGAVTSARSDQTRAGSIFGTPCYMAPEQARGDTGAFDARTDVYALGAILFTILYGERPYRGVPSDGVIEQVAAGRPPAIPHGRRPPIPPELEAVRERAMASAPADRYRDATALAGALLDWLDGAARRDQALQLVQQAAESLPSAQASREEVARLRAQAERALADIPLWAPEHDKAEAWQALARADALEARAELVEIEVEELLQGALGHDPDCHEARTLLAERWRAAFDRAERARDGAAARRARALWRANVQALPATSPTRREHEQQLKGDGQLSVRTDPPGVEVQIARYELRGRRLHLVDARSLGPAPIDGLELPSGSYLLSLLGPAGAARLPVVIARSQHLRVGADPYGTRPIRLPTAGELGPDDVLVLGGLTRLGGDPAAIGGRPARERWIDAFVLRRHPVTNAEYLSFLDDLVRQGRHDEALDYVPRERAGTVGERGAIIYGQSADRSFYLRADADGDVWLADWPVVNISWHGARAYAAWLSQKTGRTWRLPTSDEWERAGRGADGRYFPWGDHLDPSWCCMRDSRPDRAEPATTQDFPVDQSPFGVRGLAGNVRDWCGDELPQDRRINRGGFWLGNAREARLADQHDHVPSHRAAEIGFRLARDP